jgi:metallo-beta-lactamase class B
MDTNRKSAVLILAAASICSAANSDWLKPFPPHKVIGNVYYVGSNYLASYLITTPAGNILINPSYAESVPLIRDAMAKLGFRMEDVKILLISHAHDDHAAGCALFKKLSGAKLMVMEQDVPVVEGGGAGDFAYTSRWAPAKVDRVLHDGDTVSLGGEVLTARLTAGHTKGCTTWTWQAKDGGKTYNVVVVGSPNVNPGFKLVNNAKYPGIAEDYARSFRVWKSLPCDVFLGAHGVYYGLDEKYPKLKAGGANPFIDPAGYKAYIAERQAEFERKLADQKAGKPAE